MDVGILLGLFFGGAGFVYGGYTLETNHRVWAVLSYCFGTACMIAAIVLVILRATAPFSPPREQVTEAIAPTSAAPMAVPLQSDIERATPAPSNVPIPPIVTSTLIKADDQNDLGDLIARNTKEVDQHCRGLILRCPSVTCEDDSRALMGVLTRGGWDMPWEPTSHGWERLKHRVVIHSKVRDICAAILSNALHEFGVDCWDSEDAAMRKADRVDIIIRAN
ncbi:hypothetical protein [Candidatus Binatus sp.]|uniref:hypothetical protein n=1 Tax=Candidatus Binatus sp. TaxID=2811406 RepID=UPI003F9A8B16